MKNACSLLDVLMLAWFVFELRSSVDEVVRGMMIKALCLKPVHPRRWQHQQTSVSQRRSTGTFTTPITKDGELY
jgi:hypothetical protein